MTTAPSSITLTAQRAAQPWMLRGIVLLLLVAYLYAEVIPRLVGQWWNDPNFSHGFFVPIFSGMLVWQKRAKLAAMPLAPSWFGLVVIAGALATLVVGVLGAELFLSRTSLILLLCGLVIQFFGWAHLRSMTFPLAFLLLMVPIPAIIFNQIAFPLQLLASQMASWLLPLLGVPALRLGNVIHLPVMTLEVVEACSGIRSLVSLGTLAVIYGYLLEPSYGKRVALGLASIPIAVAANAMRVVGTGLLGEYWEPEKAQGFFHAFSGWVIFVLSLLMFFALHGLMKLPAKWRERRTRA